MPAYLFLLLVPIWYLTDAALWGTAFYAVCDKLGKKPTPRMAIGILTVVFGLGDFTSYFFFRALDLQFSIGNTEILTALEMQNPIDAAAWFLPEPADMFLWLILAIVAVRIGLRFRSSPSAHEPRQL